jgi:hypothetical protein
MDNILIYSATEDNFSIWQRVLPRSRSPCQRHQPFPSSYFPAQN